MGTKHAPTEMTQHDVKWKKSSAKSTGVYIGLYVCARCGRETRQIKNFLAGRYSCVTARRSQRRSTDMTKKRLIDPEPGVIMAPTTRRRYDGW